MIDVIDYRAGNAPSVLYALMHLGLDARLVSAPADVARAERLVLPGVGSAGATMASLRDLELLDALTARVVDDGAPFLGICIGLQVLFERSEEGDTKTLGWLPGEVRRFPDTLRVPQIGWNGVTPRRPHPLWAGLPPVAHCYFVNSYHAIPADPADVLATTDYGGEFCSVVAHDNVAATQFHAEKSGHLGLTLLANFARWDGSPC
ncbi:MAG TPA: imidazole glycerol phosphate synthase subunit HisH [Acidimicrobiia bacterium]|nr:imidazole glycerol phosphate synthase subunit HisH [Acidimicrobiia bacterium]